MRKLFFCGLLICTAITVNAIIYRHDVAEAEYRKLALQPQFDCVGEVIEDNTHFAGSCVLIGERYVLSAAHVFKKSDQVADTMFLYQGKMITKAEADKRSAAEQKTMSRIITYKTRNDRMSEPEMFSFRFARRIYTAKRMMILHQYLDSATRGDCDIVLIELEEPVKNVKPATMNKAFDELGSTITNVGFGASGNAAIPDDVGLYQVKLAGQNVIDTLRGRSYEGKPTLLGFDFDHPDTKAYNMMGSEIPLPLEHTCGGGDSGGGMFRETKDGWQLVGICSGSHIDIEKLLKIGYYGETATYTRVSAFYNWIKLQMEQK